MTKQKQGWSKTAKRKGASVEISAVNEYKRKGILAKRIPQKSQVGEWSKIDYIVILKGILGQGKYKKQYLSKNEKLLILDMVKNYPNSDLRAELAYRQEKYQPIKFESID
jgi:hypothetical protein